MKEREIDQGNEEIKESRIKHKGFDRERKRKEKRGGRKKKKKKRAK